MLHISDFVDDIKFAHSGP